MGEIVAEIFVSPDLDTKSDFVSTSGDVNTQRTYTMRARAESVAETRLAILEAAIRVWDDHVTATIGLGEVAAEAGVTVRTILRHFGSRDGLIEAMVEHARAEITEERESPVGDVPAAVRTIVAHYELRVDRVLRMLEEERVDPLMADHVAQGRRMHRDWVRAVFAPQLTRADDPKALEDLLVVATDVYTYKLLRRDRGLSRARTEERMHTMIQRLLGE
jgi:AcrR family transcriptional regulator